MDAETQKRVDAAFKLHRELCGSWIAEAIEARFYELLPLCESPIEQVTLARIIFFEFSATSRWSKHYKEMPQVIPQHQVGPYRVDFAIVGGDFDFKVIIECDGHDFHERTADQAAKDKARDRALQADGWVVLRFTGREIWSSQTTTYIAMVQMANRFEGVGVAL